MCNIPYEDVLGCHTSVLRVRTINDLMQYTVLIYLKLTDKEVNSLNKLKLFSLKGQTQESGSHSYLNLLAAI